MNQDRFANLIRIRVCALDREAGVQADREAFVRHLVETVDTALLPDRTPALAVRQLVDHFMLGTPRPTWLRQNNVASKP